MNKAQVLAGITHLVQGWRLCQRRAQTVQRWNVDHRLVAWHTSGRTVDKVDVSGFGISGNLVTIDRSENSKCIVGSGTDAGIEHGRCDQRDFGARDQVFLQCEKYSPTRR